MAEQGEVFTNFIPDVNRWKLPVPPAWWLKALYDFDPMLVVVPSRSTKRYLLTRRRQHSAGIGDVAMLDNKAPDTNLCYALHVVPVSTLNFSGNWTLHFLEELKARDTWRIGRKELKGSTFEQIGNRVADAIEANEQRQARKAQAELRDGFRQRAKDAWRSLQARTGQRSRPSYVKVGTPLSDAPLTAP